MALALLLVALSSRSAGAQDRRPPAARRAPHSASHWVVSGPLSVGQAQVALAHLLPVSEIRFLDQASVEVVARHGWMTLRARARRDGLRYHVHRWTRARDSLGFERLVPPDTLLEALEGSTPSIVTVAAGSTTVARLLGPGQVPEWLRAEQDRQEFVSTRCAPLRLYPRRAESEDAIATDEGQAVFARPAGGGWVEAWTQDGVQWVRGYSHESPRCEAATAAVATGSGPTHDVLVTPVAVVLPPGLRLVAPQQPRLAVLSILLPTTAESWPPGSSAEFPGAHLSVDVPCGLGDVPSRLTFRIGADGLLPAGAPDLSARGVSPAPH